MSSDFHDTYTCFAGERLAAAGPAEEVARAAAGAEDAGLGRVVLFEDRTGRQVEVDCRGATPTIAGASTQIEEETPRVPAGRGRPRLGVVAREVTLLPRHWQWLETQPGGASAALRRLIEQARRDNVDKDRAGEAQQATYRVMSVLAGNLPQFEEATRALYARDDARFDAIVARWPDDVRTYISRLAASERQARVATPAG
jgi:uncharacterized protein